MCLCQNTLFHGYLVLLQVIMKIFIKVKPKSRKEKVEKIDETHYYVWVKDPPEKGKANAAVIKNISTYFDIPKSRVTILSGLSSKQKCIEISPV